LHFAAIRGRRFIVDFWPYALAGPRFTQPKIGGRDIQTRKA
jgi:hypothetical protein